MKEFKLKKARTCNGCKAFDWTLVGAECMLNFKTRGKYNKKIRVTLDYSPLEKCYKPINYNDYIEILKAKQNNRYVKKEKKIDD
ncbi:MAG: hypothetical protein ACFFG0_02645 [Candidatus Thorarchaeota archaeon]